MGEAMHERLTGTTDSLEAPFNPDDVANQPVRTEPLVVIQKPRSRGVGVVLSLILILVASFVVYARSRSGDWQGLADELAGRWQRFVQGMVLSALQAGSEGRELPQPAPLRGPESVRPSGGVAQVGPEARARSEAGKAGAEVKLPGGDALAEAKPEAAAGELAGPPKPEGLEGMTDASAVAEGTDGGNETQDAMKSIEEEAQARNEAMAQLDKVKEQEAEELAKRPPAARGQIPRGFIMPPGGLDDAFVQQQLAEAERMMTEMLKGQMRILTDQEPMFGRLLREMDPELGRMFGLGEVGGEAGQGAAAAPGDPNANWPPRVRPRVGADALEADAFEAEMREAMRLFRALQRELLRDLNDGAGGAMPGAAPNAGGRPPVIRRQWRGPNGAQMFEFRMGG